MTGACLASGNLGAVNVDSRFGQRGKQSFLQNQILLAFFYGPHRRLCIQKLAVPKQLGAEQGSQAIWIKITRALGSKLFTDYELPKLSRSASSLPGLVPKDKNCHCDDQPSAPAKQDF